MYFSNLVNFLVDNNICFQTNVKTKDLVSIKIGGKAKLAIFPRSIDELVVIIKIIDTSKFILIGNGTNCYFTDEFIDCPIISTRFINKMSISNNLITAECGCSLNSVCKLALENSLSGLEFAFGIPGSVGGAVCMNASAFGGIIADIVVSSKIYDKQSKSVYSITNEEHQFNTKYSVFRNINLVVLETTFKLVEGTFNQIKGKMFEYLRKRASTQPLDMPSAGSVFVKPKEMSASALIDKIGLKGYSVGDAQVSTKHAGFIVNVGNASAKDINLLIAYIKAVVDKKYRIKLQEEIIYLK